MKHQQNQSRAEFEDGAWYWVEKEGWIGDPATIAPARYKAECDAWYSHIFAGIPTRQLRVLERCERQAARRAQGVQSVAGIQGGVIRGNPTFPKPTEPRAAPQPSETAPVQMPEPAGCVVYANGESHHWDANRECAELFASSERSRGAPYAFTFENLYTAQQVQEILAAERGEYARWKHMIDSELSVLGIGCADDFRLDPSVALGKIVQAYRPEIVPAARGAAFYVSDAVLHWLRGPGTSTDTHLSRDGDAHRSVACYLSPVTHGIK